MAIKIRRGLEADRTSVIFEEGEVLYTTDTKSFFIGDGVTAGGNQIGGTTAASLLKTEVHNATGATLTAGQVVYLSGNTGNKPNAVLAKADDEATSSKTIGLIILNIANNANGDIATDGLLSDIDTSAFAPGDLLWLSDSLAGGLTTVAPDTPNNAVFIGYVVAAHPTQGKILIHIQNGYELNELHDVKITSVANGDGLIYDSTLGYWKNSAEFTTQGNTFNAANKLVQLDGTAKLPAVDGSQLTNLPSFTPPNGLLKIASAISTTLQTVTDYLGNASVLFLNSRRVGIGKDTSVTTQSVAVVEVQDANTSIVLKPNGTGGIIASVPDGTATGGNARGQYAVDLQTYRTNANQVASGIFNAILSGSRHRTLGEGSVIAGGDLNIASNNGATVSGGYNHTASGQYSSVSGGFGNTASSNYATISGGQSNTASTGTHATVVGGSGNTASGTYSIAGGISSTASGTNAIALGQQAQASGTNAIALGGTAGGGSGSIASGAYSFSVTYGANAGGTGALAIGNLAGAVTTNSVALGTSSKSGAYGKFAYANGQNGQMAYCILKRSSILLNSAGTAAVYSDNSSVNYVYCYATFNAKISITCTWIATVVTVGSGLLSVGDTITGKDFFFVKSVAGVASISSINRISTANDVSMATANMTYSVSHSGTTGTFFATFVAPTTANGTTFQIVAKLETVEIGQN